MTRLILDPRFADTLADYFPSFCTIEQNEGEEDENGVIVPDWQVVAGHVDIPCAVASSGGQEVKQPNQTYVVANFKIALRGSYQTIVETMRAIVTGPNAGTYDVLLVEGSSHEQLTRLLVNEVV